MIITQVIIKGNKMARKNKVERISLSGGLIGALTTNPKRALDNLVKSSNEEGWVATQINPHSTSNIFIWLLQLVVLVCTIGLWTWGGGYLVLFEKDA